jgi:hypothetical protein
MDEKVRKLLDAIPDRPPRSKLEPHAEVIRELRKKRRTYQEIAAFFKEHLQLPVAPSTLHEFVKSRARPTRKRALEIPELAGSRALEWEAKQPLQAAPSPASPLVRPDIRETIRAVREQPVTRKEQPSFEFDAHEQASWTPKSGEK